MCYSCSPLSESFEPSRCFAALPLEATDRLLFCHWDIDAMDVVRALEPIYDAESSPKVVENQQKVLSKSGPPDEMKTQGILVDLLCQSEQKFLRNFVWFATGYMYLPQQNFSIKVEFISEVGFTDESSLPVAHSCVMLVKFPAAAYDASRQVLEEKLVMSIENALVTKFDMK
jgi:HECT-domain (ubiquitin-transferase)